MDGDIQRMCEERLTKRERTTYDGSRRRKGRTKLRWMNSVKRDLEWAELNSREWKKWQKIATDGDDSSTGRTD